MIPFVSKQHGIIVPLDKALPDNEIESLMIRSEIEAIVYSDKYDKVMNEINLDIDEEDFDEEDIVDKIGDEVKISFYLIHF